jgi:glycosyltransferase involved in cell wall biosynthesis
LSHKPLISVLMPVYNGELFLPDALESILNQSYSDFELILIDDGSTDNTYKILHKFTKEDERIKVFRNHSNLGLTRSLNSGLLECRGEFIARHDADDLSEPDRFACQVQFLNNHPDYGVIGTAVTRIRHQGSKIDHPNTISGDKRIRSYLERVNPFVHGSIMMRKRVIDMVDGYRNCLCYSQDYDLWLRLSRITFLENLSDRLYKFRVHTEGISSKKHYVQIQYAALASFFAKEREKTGKDSYKIFESDFKGDIDFYLEKRGIKGEINSLIGRLLFVYGEREGAYRSFLLAPGIINKLYCLVCKRDMVFEWSRSVARFLVCGSR